MSTSRTGQRNLPSVKDRPSDDDVCATRRHRGRCKWFNVAKGWGFVKLDDGSQDVFVHQSVIQMKGFRSLAEGEEVELETALSAKGVEATIVTGPSGSDCQGSRRQPNSIIRSTKTRKIRCFNCGAIGSHIASKCTAGPQPKRCHQCKSEEHLISDCPNKPECVQRNRATAVTQLTSS